MTDSEISEDFKRMAALYRLVANIRDPSGGPGKVLFGYPLSVSNPVLMSGNMHRPVFNITGDVYFLDRAMVYRPDINVGLDALSGDALRAGRYVPEGGASLSALLAKYQNSEFVPRTYAPSQFEFLSPKDVDARASELVEKPIVPATLAAAAPIEIATKEQVDIPRLEPHKIDRDLVLRLGVFEPRAEALTFNGVAGAVLKLGDIARRGDNYDGAINYFYQYLKQIPTSAPVWQRVFEIAKAKPVTVIRWLQTTREFAPIEPDIWLMKGQAAEIAGEPNLTFDFYYKALLKRASLNVWPNLQGAMGRIGQRDSLFARLEGIGSDSPDMWKKRARLATGVGDSRRGINYSVRALQLNPTDDALLAEIKEALGKLNR